MPDETRRDSPPSDTWRDLLSTQEWEVVLRTLGVDRVQEYRSLFSALSPTFRSRVVDHLERIDGFEPGSAVLLAAARAAHDARVAACQGCVLRGRRR